MKDQNTSAPGLKEVQSSEASHRDAKGLKDRESLIRAISDSDQEVLFLTNRSTQIQSRLFEIKACIRAAGRMNRDQYQSLCDEQAQLGAERGRVDRQVGEVKRNRLRLQDDLRSLNHGSEGSGMLSGRLLKRILEELISIRIEIQDLKEQIKKENA